MNMSADLAVATLATVHTHPPAELLQMATTLVSLHLSAATQVHPALPQSQDWRRDVFTLHEVAQHDRIEDCWLVIYDRVYDVTSFLATHPGGFDVMLEYAGCDASMAFRGCGHSDEAVQLLRTYQIGELPENERIFRCAGKLRMSDLPL